MATAYATAADVRLRWPSLPVEAVDPRCDALASDASIQIRAQYPGIDDQIASDAAAGGDLADRVKIVVINMVKRALMSGTPGAANETTGTGPYSHSVTFANPLQNLFISAADDALIRGYLPRAVTVAFPDDC